MICSKCKSKNVIVRENENTFFGITAGKFRVGADIKYKSYFCFDCKYKWSEI